MLRSGLDAGTTKEAWEIDKDSSWAPSMAFFGGFKAPGVIWAPIIEGSSNQGHFY